MNKLIFIHLNQWVVWPWKRGVDRMASRLALDPPLIDLVIVMISPRESMVLMPDRTYKFAEFELSLTDGSLRSSTASVRLQE